MAAGETTDLLKPSVPGEAGARDLYERDFYSWTQQQAALLRSGQLHAADLPNIIEEIETLGRSELNALRSRYAVLCTHLIKSLIQPERQGRSWQSTIVEQRIQIARLLEDNPGLKAKRERLFAQGYEDGRKLAATEMRIDIALVPEEPPFNVSEAEDEAWQPKSAR